MISKVYILSSILPKKIYDWIKANSIGPISNANDSLQRALVSGFISNNIDVELLNVPNIGAFPLKFRTLKSPGFAINEEEVKGHNFKFTNINLLKHRFITNRLIKSVTKISQEIECLIIYDLYLPFLEVAKLLKRKNSTMKIIIVIPDIYGFTGYSKGFIHKLLTNNEEFKIYDNLQYIDGFVLLTEKMLEKLPNNITTDKYVVVEGVLNPDVLLINEDKSSINPKVVLYSGAIEERHGIRNLIEAFKDVEINAELHLYGDGADIFKLKECAKDNCKIKFLGQQSREVILRKQREATLLINPRLSEGEFTKYSFPSKVIEYFASGTPTLMYKLEGIPDAYYNYCYTPIDETITSLKEMLDYVLTLDDKALLGKGLEAKKFVINNKNSKVQVQKILNLFDKI